MNDKAGWFAVVLAAAAFGGILAWWVAGGGIVTLPWAPGSGLRLAFRLDGLGALYALLTSGVGLVVAIYSTAYIRRHLHEDGRPPSEQIRFHLLFSLFLLSMLGLALAADLVLLVICFDLTTIASYFLIGFDRAKAEARRAAFTALVVTGTTSIALLAAAIMLGLTAGTFSIASIVTLAPSSTATAAGVLILLAAAAKSAQAPLHFWLPRAMVAPTPVSAYLHSAAMVAAGVFLLSRLYPLLSRIAGMSEMLLAIGIVSMLLGSVLALTRDVLKQILAYSTIAQYGYVVTLLGLGGAHAVPSASLYVLAHGIVKSALFLTAGAVTQATGEDRLSRLGGLAGRMRLLALASGIAAAGLAGIPLTLGFFKDEVLFTTALDRGTAWGALMAISAALTLAYTWRFWHGIFLDARQRSAHAPDETNSRAPALALTLPVVFLALAALISGMVTGPFANLATAAGTAVIPHAATLHLGYHLELRPSYLLAALAWTLGLIVIVSRPRWEPLAIRLAHLGERRGAERLYERTRALLGTLSRIAARTEARDLRGRIVLIVSSGGMLVVAAAIAAAPTPVFRTGRILATDVPLAAAFLFVAAFAIGAVLARGHLTLMLATALVNSALIAVFALRGAPDVALVGVAVGTTLTLLLIAGLSLFPAPLLRKAVAPRHGTRWQEVLTGVIATSFMFAIAWSALSRPLGDSVAARHIELTPAAHGKDVVTTILADFRGLDTLGECTVIAIVLLGVVTLTRRAERRL